MATDLEKEDVRLVEELHAKYGEMREAVSKVIVGQADVVEQVLIAVFSRGHALLVGVPGLAKTLLVRTLSEVLDLGFKRVQFTPDLMPADVTGTDVLETDENGKARITFRKGPVFTSVLLADEINRATPKTQSALLEAMQEHRVTVGGRSYVLDEPFFVLATQNPVEQDGTYPLPEAQTDRFMFKLTVDFPSPDELYDIVALTQKTAGETAQKVLSGEDLLAMRAFARDVPCMDAILRAVMRLVCATHPERADSPSFTKKYLRMGASPRAAQALVTAAKVRALTEGRCNVSFDDVRALAYPVLRHRIRPGYEAISEGLDADACIRTLLDAVPMK